MMKVKDLKILLDQLPNDCDIQFRHQTIYTDKDNDNVHEDNDIVYVNSARIIKQYEEGNVDNVVPETFLELETYHYIDLESLEDLFS